MIKESTDAHSKTVFKKLETLVNTETGVLLASLKKRILTLEEIELSIEQNHVISRVLNDLEELSITTQKLVDLEKADSISNILATLIQKLSDEVEKVINSKIEEYESSLVNQLNVLRSRVGFSNDAVNVLFENIEVDNTSTTVSSPVVKPGVYLETFAERALRRKVSKINLEKVKNGNFNEKQK